MALERFYPQGTYVSFCKTKDAYGSLSNMAPGFPVIAGGYRFPSSEHLYQACRFPDWPRVQRLIRESPNAYQAKIVARKYVKRTQPKWESKRVGYMRWVIRLKLLNNPSFGETLMSISKDIVELSFKDLFWGAQPSDGGLRGGNVLGRLLMELREEIRLRECEVNTPQIILFNEKLGINE